MKKFIGFFMILSLQAAGAENIQIECSGANGKVSIIIEEHCLSIIVRENVLAFYHAVF